MKTVLVLTLLAVTIACCYARPAERANEPSRQSSHDSETAEHSQYSEHPGNFTVAMYNLLMDYFFYILGMKEPLIIQCFEFPHCFGESLVLTNVAECCILLRRMSYREVITGRCMDCH